MGSFREYGKQFAYHEKETVALKRKSSPFGGAGAQAPERVLQYDLQEDTQMTNMDKLYEAVEARGPV